MAIYIPSEDELQKQIEQVEQLDGEFRIKTGTLKALAHGFYHAHPVNSHGPTATGCTHSSEYRPSYVIDSCVAASPSKDRNPLNG